MDPDINLTTIIIAIAGATGTILSFIVGRREKAFSTDAQAASDISAAFKELVSGLTARIELVEKENKELRAIVDEHYETRAENSRLMDENEELRKSIELLKAENVSLQERVTYLEAKLAQILEAIDKGISPEVK